MEKSTWPMVLLTSLLLVGCSNTKSDAATSQPILPNDPMKNSATSENEAIIKDLHKKVALDTVNGIAEYAKEGKVYRPDNGLVIGKTEIGAVHKTIGLPEEIEGDYERYHMYMGNPAFAFKYDEDGILEEVSYFGTTIERQTNLGGVTEKELTEQLGKPVDTREVAASGERTLLYYRGDFELQFIISEDGAVDHVNLKYSE